MKKICLMIGMIWIAGLAHAQVGVPPAPKPAAQPVGNPNQLPNYSQNNASYINNSMQNNKPVNPNAGPFTGNADYVDPTRNTPPSPIYNNNTNQLPAPSPVNSPNGLQNTEPAVNKR